MIWAKIYLFFGGKYFVSVIPIGKYCYAPDVAKNKYEILTFGFLHTYWVVPCPYYKTLGRRWNGCQYCGVITDDMVFDDQCKICGQNDYTY
jgi:hypothetical protein